MSTQTVPAEPALLLDVTAVAQMLGVSVRHVWRMADAGEFPRAVSVGAKLKRWPRATVLAWIESQTTAAARR
jgi:excisionase family DNA binding protein